MNTQMPIGLDDFKKVRENYYFVDKTHFIQSIIDGHSKLTHVFQSEIRNLEPFSKSKSNSIWLNSSRSGYPQS
ncbi:AAA family ATPase [Megasphaera elsdenii]|uniref:AAA family ATPase n=1 Tax=Megasphaera elsdenii TaxID=907 RepID=UPI00242ACF88|nr:AAA family ATPase [Megasphaera elsdenii]